MPGQPWALSQVAEIATGDRPRVDGEFVDEIVVPCPDEVVRHQIGTAYQSSFVLRRRADGLLQQAITDVETLIDGNLDEAACVAQGADWPLSLVWRCPNGQASLNATTGPV